MNNNNNKKPVDICLTWFTSIILGLFISTQVWGSEPVCAHVKIEIKQELTLERQAFDAMMRINNGLDTLAIDDVNVTVSFQDQDGNSVLATSDPNNTSAKFYIRIDSMENITDVSGGGSVAPETTAEIHWLIIPSPGAAGSSPAGKLHYVGANLSYTLGGEPETVEVTPDFITVKPLPLLSLDYFLTKEVRGDDPLTEEVESIDPFTLGVRVKNNGAASAEDVKIDSAQPKIVDNQEGLLVGFDIIGSSVNGQPRIPALLIDFGEIEGNHSKVGRWQMTSTLAGEFIEFNAVFSHSDALGGAVTSLLEATSSHFLIHDVRADLPGRDGINDFLAKDGDVLRLYESSGLDSLVEDYSEDTLLSPAVEVGTRRDHTLTFPISPGFSYSKIPAPYGDEKTLVSVVRSDHKALKSENYWISRTRNKTTNPYSWDYFINLLDANGTGSYALQFDDEITGPVAPVIQFIPNHTTHEGKPIGFLVEASDPNGDPVTLNATPLPAGVSFVDHADGTAHFNWTPGVGQSGKYTINFVASDGQLTNALTSTITVNPLWDTDGDGMADAWELEHFGNLDRDGYGDFDGDGITDLQEYLDNDDPASGPQPPAIQSPLHDAEVTSRTPAFVVVNVPHTGTQTLTYNFELFADESMAQPVVSVNNVTEGSGTTSWISPVQLEDNHTYRWRVRSFNGHVYSLWNSAAFFVNTANDAPGEFGISTPSIDGEVSTFTPLLEVTNSNDIDNDRLHYNFVVYSDSSLTNVVTSVQDIVEGVSGSTSWLVDTPLLENNIYYWRVTVIDEHGSETMGPVGNFFVNTGNDIPEPPTIDSPLAGSVVDSNEVSLQVFNAVDLDGDTLFYIFELDTVATFDGANLLNSGDIVETTDKTGWLVSGLLEDHQYYWRVKVSDGAAESSWAQGDFFVNTENDAPDVPTIANPGSGAWVATLEPMLEVNQAGDPDGDEVNYEFELYTGTEQSSLIGTYSSASQQWIIQDALENNNWYNWRARSIDSHGAESSWTEASLFFTDDNGYNDAPTVTFSEPSTSIDITSGVVDIRWDDQDPDSNALISLYYDTDSSGEDGILIVAGLEEDSEEDGDAYRWNVTQIHPGQYWVYAVIDDGFNTETVYLAHPMTVQATEIVLDNTDLSAQVIGGWVASTGVSGFVGDNYFYHMVNGPSPDSILVDNQSVDYDTLGQWTDSTAISGFYGANYQYHAPNGAAVGGVILDNTGPAFSVTGDWVNSTAINGYQGENYQYHAANGAPPSGIVMDNSDPAVEVIGNWNRSTSVGGYTGSNYQYHGAGNGSNSYTWPIPITESGRYHVYARWTSHSNRASNAPYAVTHDAGTETIRVDQRTDGDWVLLGSYDYSAGYLYNITLTDDADSYVIADAVKLVPENAPPNTATWAFTPVDSGTHKVYARWTAHPNRATNAHYEVTGNYQTQTHEMNQQQNGGEWQLLGQYDFSANNIYPIKLTDQANGYVIADAIKVVPENAQPNSALWQFSVPDTEQYRVYGRWSAHPNRATNAPFHITHSSGSNTILANQQENGGEWNLLSTYEFIQGQPYAVGLTDQADGYVIADAIKISPVDAEPNRFVWNFDVPVSGQYEVYARWSSHPNRASNATYVIAHNNGDSPVIVNQKQQGARWNLLGTYSFTQGGFHYITLTDEADGYVIADGIKLIPVTQ